MGESSLDVGIALLKNDPKPLSRVSCGLSLTGGRDLGESSLDVGIALLINDPKPLSRVSCGLLLTGDRDLGEYSFDVGIAPLVNVTLCILHIEGKSCLVSLDL